MAFTPTLAIKLHDPPHITQSEDITIIQRIE